MRISSGQPCLTTRPATPTRHCAIAFSKEWQGETREAGERNSFRNDFFNVFGVRRDASNTSSPSTKSSPPPSSPPPNPPGKGEGRRQPHEAPGSGRLRRAGQMTLVPVLFALPGCNVLDRSRLCAVLRFFPVFSGIRLLVVVPSGVPCAPVVLGAQPTCRAAANEKRWH